MKKAKAGVFPIASFAWEATDPLAAEHELITQLVAETLAGGWHHFADINLDFTEAGRKILAGNPAASARLVFALVARLVHFDRSGKQVADGCGNEMERVNWRFLPAGEAVWLPRHAAGQVLQFVMRRKPPLTREHLIALADWMIEGDWINDVSYPLKPFIKAVEAQGTIEAGDQALRASLSRLAKKFRDDRSKDTARLAQRIENMLGTASETPSAPENTPMAPAGPNPAEPASVGSPRILIQLKQYLGILPAEAQANIEVSGLDHFPLRTDSPLRAEHDRITSLLPEVIERPGYHEPDLTRTQNGQAMLGASARANGRLLLALAERCANADLDRGPRDHRHWQSHYAVAGAFRQVLNQEPKLDRDELFDVLLFLSALADYRTVANLGSIEKFLAQVEQLPGGSLSAGERHVLHRVRCRSVRTPPFGRPNEEVARINRLVPEGSFQALVPGEAWSDQVNRDLSDLPPPARGQWLELLQHASLASGSRPSAKWLKNGRLLLHAIGAKAFSEHLLRWLSLVNEFRTIRSLAGMMSVSDGNASIQEDNATCLRGLLWIAPEVVSAELIRAIGAATISCYRKIPGVGARAVRVGNAGVYALGQIDDLLALGQLALLKVKVKQGSVQKEIEKAFQVAAERSGLPRDEIEEMSVPTYGLTEVGVTEEQLGEFTARLSVTGTTTTELVWLKDGAKPQRAVPAAVKQSSKEELKELQAAAKDIQKMLPAQRERIDGMFLQQRAWPFQVWRERYLDHPLVGTLARRILWDFTDSTRTITGIWFEGRLVDLDLRPIEPAVPDTTVRLWHPIGRSTEEIAGWRGWLDAQQIQQPFKQAHREIYLLTAAEQRTRTYSNRFAAHILKQHQFNALCALRGWKNQLRLMVDSEYAPPCLRLPRWNLRAEFWVEGIGQDYGSDTNENGVYLRLSTDQVRFYRTDDAPRAAHAGGGGYRPGYPGADGDPLPLEEIPALVFSEVMRDVDMFVGVASVGNDPAWSDGGPEGRYRDYWQSYSFGDLNASAATRKTVLERIVPKLKIARQCSFEEKFLVVQGSLRAYRIHLGSGNILMKPNDQYLCIVPKPGESPDSPVLLPFEGDRTLSVILSKAFLLADDAKIKDDSITHQIRQK